MPVETAAYFGQPFRRNIGGWQLAAVHAGVKPVWSSEIEAFPIEVTRRHFPDTLQLGDVTKIDGGNIPPVDIICAGSPCQDLSVAGKRAGLAGERSGLFVRAVDIVRQMRLATDGEKPRFFVWENVPGAFSSNHRRDFQAVLEEIGQAEVPMPKSGRWADAGLVRTHTCDIAWRVLDAQYWGVPQRRKRIFLVADFTETGRRAGEILFGIRRNQKAEEIHETRRESPPKNDGVDECVDIFMKSSFKKYREKRIAGTLRASGSDFGGGSESLVTQDGKNLRRLTPLECERLQGLPDGWTEGGSDTARYKAIGNGMAQPCADYVLKRIAEVTGE